MERVEVKTWHGRSPSRGRKLEAIWSAMLERTAAGEHFTAAAIATAAGAAPRFVRSYCATLAANGYLVQKAGTSWNPDPQPRHYQVGQLYREAIAPQLAGGSGGGNAMGKGWKNLKELPPPPAPAKPPRAKRSPPRSSLARSKRRRAAVTRKNKRKGKR